VEMMKKCLLILSLLLISTVVYATSDLDKEYKMALQEYKKSNFASSYEKFSKLYLTNLSDVNLNFYLGRSAYESGHYEMALAAFERVEMLDPSNLSNKLEMARTYFMLKMYEDAQFAFTEVLKNPNIPQNVRTNIELYLSKVSKVQEKSFTYASVNLDYVYDSNVNYGSLDSDYNIYVNIPVHTETLADSAGQLYGDVTNIYDIGNKNGFAIKNRLVGLVKDYLTENDYDTMYVSYMPSLLYKQTNYLLEFGVGVDDLMFGTENYLQSYSVMPRLEYAHTTTLRSIGYFKYQMKSFQRDQDKVLDANHFELSYGLQKILSPHSYIQGTLIGINEAKTQGTNPLVDYIESRVNVAYGNQFTSTYGMDVFAEYRKRDYSDKNLPFDSVRADNAGTVAVNLNAKVWQTLSVHLKGMYTKVESNQAKYSYEKQTVTLGLNKTF
jgi:tetratricopeptide (TPR) repeat protein